MNRKPFEEYIKASPNHWRLIFCYGPNLFAFDTAVNQYSNLAIQIAYEVWQQSSSTTVMTCRYLNQDEKKSVREKLEGMLNESRIGSTR